MLTENEIVTWLKYWDNMRCVAVDEIRIFSQVAPARRFCEVMREGAFQDVPDLQIWRSIKKMRGIAK